MFSPIKYFLVISQVDQNSASEFHAMLSTCPPTDQTTVSTQPPCLGVCCERGRLPNEKLRNAANPAQEHRWPNPTHSVGHVSDLYPGWEVHAPSPISRQIMMLPPHSALRISCRVSIKSRDLEPFHSIEQYRVLNPQYQISFIPTNCDFFCLFFAEKVVF